MLGAVANGNTAGESAAGGSGQKLLLADLPEAPEVPPSEDTMRDLADIKAWPACTPLSAGDIVVVKGAWNRTLAFKDATMEAMVYRWVLLDSEIYTLLRLKFDELPHDMFQMIDKCVRALDKRTEVHHRESYTPGFPACVTRDFGDDPADIMSHYTLMGVRPKHWCLLKEAFLFALKTHNPYCYKEHDGVDLDKGYDGAIARFFHIHVVQKAHGCLQKLVDVLQSPIARVVQRQAVALKDLQEVGQSFYHTLLTKYPDLCDYFAEADMDHLAQHLQQTLAVVGTAGVGLRDTLGALSKLAHVHREAMIPADAFPKVGEVLVETLSGALEMRRDVVDLWVFAYMSCSAVISAPMAVAERLYADAEEFFVQVAKEQEWGAPALQARLNHVKLEIGACGTYRHTSEELQLGARLAWRNAPKCIGRIAWDTLVVRDCRHITTAAGIFEECKEHLKIAAGGGIIQSLMTIFTPKQPNEQWGTRFWNPQFCRYAGYRQADGSVLGDPANVEYTEMVMRRFRWRAPEKRTPFDPLPQVVQLPGEEPVMCEFSRELFCEIPLSHPKHTRFARLGLKWTSLPTISNFNLRIGGVDYPCCPFNGWFVDLEIARNLVERYQIGPDVAKICGFDMSSDSTGWRSMVLQAVSCAVTHSFQKKRFSIVDHYTVSTQFLTHVDREKQCGREVPAQWSWIGGFAGVHCPVWHFEMRDFYLRPQYHYMADRWRVEEVGRKTSLVNDTGAVSEVGPRRVLILYASTTGSSMQYARRMAKELGLGYRPRVMELNSFSEEVARRFTHILCCVSTFNNGVSPFNGTAFPETLPFQLVNSHTGRPIKFAVMALGSSIYPHFCAFGKKVAKTLQEAGGVRFVSTVLADECKSQATAFEKFLRGVRGELEPCPAPPNAVEPVLEVKLGQSGDPARSPAVSGKPLRGHARATVVDSEVLMSDPAEDRCTRRIRIDIADCSGMTYTTGGHLSVLPCNPDDEIAKLCYELDIRDDQLNAKVEALMVEGEDSYPASLGFQNGVTLRDALKWHVDITVRPANFQRILAMVRDAGGMSVDEYNELTQKDSAAAATDFWWVSSVLRAFPRAWGKVSLAALFSTLSAQFPRLYSIASSHVVSPTEVELCVGLVSVNGKWGLASGHLHSLEVGSHVWVSTKASSSGLPESKDAPFIMVGAGSGVAPFVGFVQERMHLGCTCPGSEESRSKALLFFGCRSRSEVLHEGLFTGALKAKALSAYSVALSREPGKERRYVTDALRQEARQLWELLQRPDCHYYVCGDARMADSAYEALLHCIARGGQVSRARAVAFMDNMRAEGRYHLDVWGLITHSQMSGAGGRAKPGPLAQNMAKQWMRVMQDRDEDEETAISAVTF